MRPLGAHRRRTTGGCAPSTAGSVGTNDNSAASARRQAEAHVANSRSGPLLGACTQLGPKCWAERPIGPLQHGENTLPREVGVYSRCRRLSRCLRDTFRGALDGTRRRRRPRQRPCRARDDRLGAPRGRSAVDPSSATAPGSLLASAPRPTTSRAPNKRADVWLRSPCRRG